jgi:hypothetical protein
MPISVTCPSCGRVCKAPDSKAGGTGTCPGCRATVHIPASSPGSASAGAASPSGSSSTSPSSSAVWSTIFTSPPTPPGGSSVPPGSTSGAGRPGRPGPGRGLANLNFAALTFASSVLFVVSLLQFAVVVLFCLSWIGRVFDSDASSAAVGMTILAATPFLMGSYALLLLAFFGGATLSVLVEIFRGRNP